MTVKQKRVVRVAVIGIGSAGLAQLKQLKEAYARPAIADDVELELVGFESRADVGGIWNEDPTPAPFVRKHLGGEGAPEKTLLYPAKGSYNTTAIYDGLVATLPADLMAFRDLTFPEDTPVFATSGQISTYLRTYASTFGLYPHIRLNTYVERLYQNDSKSRRWTLESRGEDGHRRIEDFDYVSISNGHYNDPWIPPSMKGLSSFPGLVQHSREFRRASQYAGKTVLVVGSFNSGSDIARLIGGLNIHQYDSTGAPLHPDAPPKLAFARVYQSSTGMPNSSTADDPDEPWRPYITQFPLIDHFDPPSPSHPKGRVQFQDGASVDDVDVVIFATGYSNSLPFCKVTDEPWRSMRPLDEVIQSEEREGGDEWEVGGLRGLKMRGLDELLIFSEGDRSLAYIGLAFQITPFPFAEVQARLVALLWAGLLPNFPSHPVPPPNPALQATITPPLTPNALTPPSETSLFHNKPREKDGLGRKERISVAQRKEFIFAVPYEWTYTEYVFSLTAEAEGEGVEQHWKEVEPWRRAQKADTGMRKRFLGY